MSKNSYFCLHVSVTWEVCEGIFAAVSFSNGASELLENVVELRRTLQRPVLCHTKALFQSVELPLVRYQLLYMKGKKLGDISKWEYTEM